MILRGSGLAQDHPGNQCGAEIQTQSHVPPNFMTASLLRATLRPYSLGMSDVVAEVRRKSLEY